MAHRLVILSEQKINGECKKQDSEPDNTIKDNDGTVYTAVTIGTHVWLVETKFSTAWYASINF